MPNTPILALTATATACYRKEIVRSLGMQNIIAVEANPNRENIFYRVLPRGNRGDGKLIDVIKPYVLELKEKLILSPFQAPSIATLKPVVNVIVILSKNLGNSSTILLGLLQISATVCLLSTMHSIHKKTVLVELKV